MPMKKSPARSAAKAAPKGVKAPHALDREVAAKVLAQIAAGSSLTSICKRPGMPSMTTFMRWLGEEDADELREQYARAREAQAELMAEEIIAISDEECTTVRADKHGTRDEGGGNTEVLFDATAVARNRLRVDARKWLLSKMAPKKYGDKLEHTGPNGGAIHVQSTVTFVRPPPREGDE